MRLFNPSSEAVEATLLVGPEIRRAAWTTLLESPIDYVPVNEQRIAVPFEPYEVGTIWLDLVTPTHVQATPPVKEILHLQQNFPNPFSRHTIIRYHLHQHAEVRLNVYDVLGRRVSELEVADQPPGQYSHSWTGTDQLGLPLASGVYFYTLEATTPSGNRAWKNRTMILIR